jgi:hypothetical protein
MCCPWLDLKLHQPTHTKQRIYACVLMWHNDKVSDSQKIKFKPKYNSSTKNEILQLLEWECGDPWKEIKNSKRCYLIELLSQLVNEFSKLNRQSYEGGLGVGFIPWVVCLSPPTPHHTCEKVGAPGFLGCGWVTNYWKDIWCVHSTKK